MAEPACQTLAMEELDPLEPDFAASFPPIDADFLDTLPADGDLAFPDGFMDDISFADDLDFSLDDLLQLPHTPSAADCPTDSTISLASASDSPDSAADLCTLNVSSPEYGDSGGDSSGSVSDNRSSNVNPVPDPPSPDSDSKSSSLSSSMISGNAAAVGSIRTDSNSPAPAIKSEDVIKPATIAKRKKESIEGNPSFPVAKVRRSGGSPEETDSLAPAVFRSGNTEDDKRHARLMRNRESAQLSRQRKKHYVEELEEKVRSLHSTIAELNGKLSYFMAENVSLRQHLSGGGAVPVPSPGIYPGPPPPMAAAVHFPWIPGTPFVVKPQGSQVPLVPIPRIKAQQPASAPKSKKSDLKKTDGGKTKKVASVSLLGLLFFLLLFGGLVPIVNVRYGSITNLSRLEYGNGGYMGQPRGQVLAVRGPVNGSTDCNTRRTGVDFKEVKMEQSEKDKNWHSGNASEPLVASLYVPRNDKLVKIDGNLIIHSVLASERAMASSKRISRMNSGKEKVQVKDGENTGLAIPDNLGSALAISKSEVDVQRHPHIYRNPSEQLRALGSGSGDNYDDKRKSTTAEGPLQQWFREGLAGPIMSSGMCTEVFKFEVSSNKGAIVSADSVVNASDSHPGYPTARKMKNRRILHPPIPLPSSTFNKTKESPGKSTEEGKLHGNSSVSSSMVVSVLVDPREAVDADGESMISPKPNSLSRIFVVVLLDSVKYVTYSCVLPIKGSGHHLVAK